MLYELKDVANIRSGYSFRGAIQPVRGGKFKIIQIKDVGHYGEISYENLTRLDLKDVKPAYFVHQGDILFIARGNRSEAVLVDEGVENTVFGLQFFAIKTSSQVLPEYLAWYINQRPAQRYFEKTSAGSNVKLITKSFLEALPVSIPPITVQHEIVHMYQLARKEDQLVEQIRMKREQLMAGVLLSIATQKTRADKRTYEE